MPPFVARRPVVFGHRGAAGTRPENTHAGFWQAFAERADGIELDVRCCGSGEVVVIHDETVDRTSDGHTGRVAHLSLSELRRFDFGYGKGFGRETIPTLEEVFTRLPAGKLINVEIKNDDLHSHGEERAVAHLIAEFKLQERCLVSSFNPLVLWRLQQHNAYLSLAYLYRPQSRWYLRYLPITRWLRLRALHPHHTLVTAHQVAQAHRQGLQVNTWTVNDEADLERVVNCGVDGIVTDYPARVVDWLNAWPERFTAA
ncbi:MAG: glycerophosphodiester phosphodiesterase [Acidobacteriota bacterium]